MRRHASGTAIVGGSQRVAVSRQTALVGLEAVVDAQVADAPVAQLQQVFDRLPCPRVVIGVD